LGKKKGEENGFKEAGGLGTPGRLVEVFGVIGVEGLQICRLGFQSQISIVIIIIFLCLDILVKG
jgi:hypothetical protein